MDLLGAALAQLDRPVTEQDTLLIRLSSQEDITDWETREDNTAGSLRISSGSGIVMGIT